jgi:glucokinase
MVTNLLVIDISPDRVTIAEFDLALRLPVYTEQYSLMEYRDAGTVLAGHFGGTRQSSAETCCVICDALRSEEWIIPFHDPRMRFRESMLKTLSGIKNIFLLSQAEALAFSTLMPEELQIQHLAGEDLLSGSGMNLTIELDNAVACNLLSRGAGGWEHRRIIGDPDALPGIPFLQDFIHHCSVRLLLSESGLTKLHDWVSIRNGRDAQGLLSAEILAENGGADEEIRALTAEHYFALLYGFFGYLRSVLKPDVYGPVVIIRTSRPAEFGRFFLQHAASSSALPVYLIRHDTPRLYGAAAWYRHNMVS